jgi:serine/threonine protein kinase
MSGRDPAEVIPTPIEAEQSTDRPTLSQQGLASKQSTASTGDRPLADPSGHVLARRYRLIKHIGAGAMGTVYQAEDLKLQRMVAIKVLPQSSTPDPAAVARFRREARALAQLSHANIVQAYDEDEDAGRHFLVMEFVEGQTLAALLKRHGQISPTRAASYGWQAAQGLAHAHERGLVHRDLKPSNLLITSNGEVKVLDLGLARFLLDQIGDASLTSEGIGLGTPDYMAPEQFRNARSADPRADIYSLGCTLYHLIAGQAPFPTSSIAEKFAAHEGQVPRPLEETCPDVPGGLTLAISRMMAKRPEERFQSAAGTAEALAPYVSGSSHAFKSFKPTASWHGSQLGIKVAPAPANLHRRTWIAAGGAVLTTVLLMLVLWAAGVFRGSPGGPDVAKVPEPTPPPKAFVRVDPNVLTVSQDDRGEFPTIIAALSAINAGQTIQILDSATYEGQILLNSRELHAGITIESLEGATLQTNATGVPLIMIQDVPGVTIRDLRLRAQGPRQALLVANGAVPGLLVERLDLDTGKAGDYDGIQLFGTTNPSDQPPVVIRNCTIRRSQKAIVVAGLKTAGSVPQLTNRVIVTGNRIVQPSTFGILAGGKLADVQIVGNRVENAPTCHALQFEDPVEPRGILAANNTFFKCAYSIVMNDCKVAGQRLEVVNNLVLDSTGVDFLDVDFPTEGNLRVGNPTALKNIWTFRANWREGAVPVGESIEAKSWIPPEPDDVRQDQIEVWSRDPTHVNFLQPAADSPLATSGVGGDLPAYVGAVPPEGTAGWHWKTTWDSRHPNMFLTVSKDRAAGGQFRTLKEALLNVKRPNMTIRILDNAVYDEQITIGDKAHAGLTLAALQQAQLQSSSGTASLITVRDVPRVTIRGLRLRSNGPKQTLIKIATRAPELLIDGLQFDGIQPDYDAIIFWGVRNESNDPPAIVQNCIVRRPQIGLGIQGSFSAINLGMSSRIVLRDNLVIEPIRGLSLTGACGTVAVVGNRVVGATQCGIHVHDLTGQAPALIANNSCLDCAIGVLVSGSKAEPDGPGVEFANNVLFRSESGDMVFLKTDSQGNPQGAGDTLQLAKQWRVKSNLRDVTSSASDATLATARIPPGPDDLEDANPAFLSLQVDDPDFLRPAADSPLATKGAGGDLPVYVGAMPPPGAEPWNWDDTWKGREPKPSESIRKE